MRKYVNTRNKSALTALVRRINRTGINHTGCAPGGLIEKVTPWRTPTVLPGVTFAGRVRPAVRGPDGRFLPRRQS